MWPLAIVLVVLLYLYMSRWMDTVYWYAAGIALIGHFFVAIVVLPRVPYGWDIAKFNESAVLILSGQVPEYATTVSSFGMFQAIVYSLTGPDPLSLSIINGFIAILIPFSLRYVMNNVYPTLQTTDLQTLIVLFLPLPFVMMTVPMRDSLTILVFTTVIALIVQTIVEYSLRPAILATPLWGMLYLFRAELALVIVIGGGAALFVFCVDFLAERTISFQAMIIAMAPVGILGFFLFTARYPLDTLQGRVSYRASGSAAYLESFQYASWLDVIISAPGRAIYFQFAPFPLHVNQVFHLIALLSLPVLIVLAIASIVSIYQYDTHRITLIFLLTIYGTGIVGYGLIDSNFGTTARHRVPFVFLLVIFASPVFDNWGLKLRRTYDISK